MPPASGWSSGPILFLLRGPPGPARPRPGPSRSCEARPRRALPWRPGRLSQRMLASRSTLSVHRPSGVGVRGKRLGWWTRRRSHRGCPCGRRRRCFDGFEQSEVHQAVSVYSASHTSHRGRLLAGARSGEFDLTRRDAGHASTQRLSRHAPRMVRLGWLSPSSGGGPAPARRPLRGPGGCPTCAIREHAIGCAPGLRGNRTVGGCPPPWLVFKGKQSRPGSQRSSSSRAAQPQRDGNSGRRAHEAFIFPTRRA